MALVRPNGQIALELAQCLGDSGATTEVKRMLTSFDYQPVRHCAKTRLGWHPVTTLVSGSG